MPKLLMVIAVFWVAATGSPAQTLQSVNSRDTSQTEAPAAPAHNDQDKAAWFGSAVGHILDGD